MPLINPVPNPVTLHMRLARQGPGPRALRKWGRPVEVPRVERPEEALVNQVFGRYLLVLAELFEEHAATCLPQEVAEQGAGRNA